MRNGTLHATLEAFTLDVASALQTERDGGAEVAFEMVEEPGRGTPLYCYRPLTGRFIDERLGLLITLPTYAAAARALENIETLPAYLRYRGETRIDGSPREQARTVLALFLAAVFAERDQFEFDRTRFEMAFAELERTIYKGRCVNSVVAPLLGVALDPDTREVSLGDGLSLVRGETLDDVPVEAVWGDGYGPNVLAVFSAVQDCEAPSPVAQARARFRRVLTALRLFEPGGYALGPTAWTRPDIGAWRPFALPFSGRPRLQTTITARQEDELRGFFNLIARRIPAGGSLSWALARFEMGAERLGPFEALTDYLLAARALLEPEGPASGRVAPRLAAICANPAERPAMRERLAQAVVLERSVMLDEGPLAPGSDALVLEFSEQVRALLRDLVCGHLDTDVCALADELLAEPAPCEPAPDGLEQDTEAFEYAPASAE
jgi:hypothetical protein